MIIFENDPSLMTVNDDYNRPFKEKIHFLIGKFEVNKHSCYLSQ